MPEKSKIMEKMIAMLRKIKEKGVPGLKRLWDRFADALWLYPHDVESRDRYKLLRRNIIILMLVVTILPLVFMAVINHHQYQSSLRNEIINPTHVLVNKTKHSFELFLEERLSTLKFIASAYAYNELADEKTIGRIFRVIKTEFGGFVDLGLLNSQATMVSYAGPYELRGKTYSHQTWFHEVSFQGNYISDVFMGYRKFPHIAIAVQHLGEDSRNWILRATIDTQKFESLILAMDLDDQSDAFLINRQGVLQTNSRFYGKVMEKFPIPIPAGSIRPKAIEAMDPNGRKVLIAYAPFSEHDFTLILIKTHAVILQSWYTLKNKMFYVFAISVTLIILVVFILSDNMVKNLREADEKREYAFREMEHSHKLSSIGRLAAGVAHEINNPLAIINEKAGLMSDLVKKDAEFPKKDKFMALTNSILNSVDRCKKITHRLLGFARRMEVQLETLDINEVIREIVGFLEKEALYRNIDVRLHLPDELPRISSDRGQLQQMFLNILTNAISSIDNGGQIDIRSWRENEDTLGISIKDTGWGMSEETMRHIFEPFFTTKHGYGTGLGLPITYGIIRKFGGDIKVQSKEGEGTTFTLSLPIIPERNSKFHERH